jgi:hypothetical protein
MLDGARGDDCATRSRMFNEAAFFCAPPEVAVA